MTTGDFPFMRRSALVAILSAAALLCAGAAFAQAPAAPAQAPVKVDKKSGVGPKSKGEAEAVNAVIQSQIKAPDDEIAAVEALLSKYADTVYKAFALEIEAEAYQKKNDNVKAITYGEQALAADPRNYDADNLLANILAATTRDTDLDKEEKLTRADKYAHDAIAAVQEGKPAIFATASDEAWNKTKASVTAQAWQALGIVATDRKKDDEAVADFQKGLDAFPDPLLMIRMGRTLYAMKKFDEAIALDQKVMDLADAPAQYKSIAQADRARATMAKTSASK
jgi:tetratricopeptide (TPR) repeat protein